MGDAEDLEGGEFWRLDIKVGVVACGMDTGVDAHQKGAHDHLGEAADLHRFLQGADVGNDDFPAFSYQGFHGDVVEQSPVGIGASVEFHWRKRTGMEEEAKTVLPSGPLWRYSISPLVRLAVPT